MSDKPEALRLADSLEQGKFLLSVERDATAAELRRLHAEIEEWRTKAAAWLASPEAAQRLEGYRELGRLVERAEAQRDALRDELREATEAVDDPAVNNLRTLPESIRMLRAQRDELLEALAAYRREIGLLTGVPDEQPCDAEIALRAALERQEMDDKEAAAFHAGAKAMFDALLYRVANHWHPASQVECDAQNDWATEWATDALDEVSPESCTKWRSITQAWADGYNLGMGLGTARGIERAHGNGEEE